MEAFVRNGRSLQHITAYTKSSKKIEETSMLAAQWSILRQEYEDAWALLGENDRYQEIEAIYKQSRVMEGTLEGIGVRYKDNKKLIQKCFESVKAARGL